MNRLLYFLLLLLSPHFANGQSIYRQSPMTQPAVNPNALPAADDQNPAITDDSFRSDVQPLWIWGADNDRKYLLSHTVSLQQSGKGRLKASCDNSATILINGQQVASGSDWQEAMDVDVSPFLVDGDNRIEARVENAGGVAAFVLHMVVVDADGDVSHVVTDTSWSAKDVESGQSAPATQRGALGDGPWGNVFEDSVPSGRVPRGTFEILPGYQVDRLFTVPKEELGSWVCLARDGQGRLLASDQGNQGICRITPPPLSGRIIRERSE